MLVQSLNNALPAPLYSTGTAIQYRHRYTVLAPLYSTGTAIQYRHRCTVPAPLYITGTAFYMYLPNINSNINIKISQNLWILFLSNFHLDLVWSYVTVRFLARFPLNICEADRRLRNIQPVVACEVESSVLHWHKPTSLAIRFIILFLCSS